MLSFLEFFHDIEIRYHEKPRGLTTYVKLGGSGPAPTRTEITYVVKTRVFGTRPQTHKFLSLNRCLFHFFCLPCGGGLSGEIGGAAPTRPILHMLSNLEVSYDIEFHIITELEF